FMRDWVASNYASRLFALWSEEDPTVGGIEIVVQPPARPTPKPVAGALVGAAEATGAASLVQEERAGDVQAPVHLNGVAKPGLDAAPAVSAAVPAAAQTSGASISAPLDP